MPERVAFWVRIWIAGHKVVDDPLTESNAAELIPAHMQLIESAVELGTKYLIEFEDPDLPDGENKLRWGDDTIGMVEPQPLPPGGVAEALMGEMERRLGL